MPSAAEILEKNAAYRAALRARCPFTAARVDELRAAGFVPEVLFVEEGGIIKDRRSPDEVAVTPELCPRD